MALSNEVTSAAELIAADLAEGRGSRRSIGSPGIAFGWTTGLPVTIADFVTTAQTESLAVPVTTVTPTGTPAARVAAGAPKPTAATVVGSTVTLPKYSGLATVTLEAQLGAVGLIPAITSVLGAQALVAFEQDAIAALAAGSTLDAGGADWLTALIAGQAAVLGAGGVPSVMVVSAADYGAAISAITGGAGFAANPGSAIGSVLGSLVHVSPGAPAGKAYVLDSAAVVCFEHVSSPLLIVDWQSMADTNQTRVVADIFATTVVVAGGMVAEVTVTP